MGKEKPKKEEVIKPDEPEVRTMDEGKSFSDDENPMPKPPPIK